MNFQRHTLLSALALSIFVPATFAQCDDWRTGPVQNDQTQNGSDGVVYSLTAWNPGSPMQQPMLVAGGNFTRMEDASVQNIAVLDPSTDQWSPLGDLSTFNSEVHALLPYGSQLLAGSGNRQVGGLALRWSGSAWLPTWSGFCMPTFINMTPENIQCFGVYQGVVYGGGAWGAWFSDTTEGCSGQSSWGLSRWDGGSHWLNNPVDFWASAEVLAFTQFGSQFIVGGEFGPLCSCEPGEHIAAWDGTSWSRMAGGLSDDVRALAVFQGQLYAGGNFARTEDQSLVLNSIARWDGSAWHALGSGLNGAVTSLTVYQNNLIVGGLFTASGPVSLNHIASWDGSAWHALGSGTNNTVECLTSWNTDLVAGGDFTAADGQPANHIARWDGVQWSSFGGGTVSSVLALTQFGFNNSRVIAGGSFQQSTRFTEQGHNVVSWNGLSLSPLGTGMNAPVHALKSFSTTVVGQTTFHLVAGGEFTTAGGLAASRVAQWNENANNIVTPPAWTALGSGFNNTVFAIERFNNVIYAAGAFTTSGSTSLAHIAQWNGSAWVGVGSGLNGVCNALKVYNGQLYAGGSFTTAGGLSSGGLARWNGTSWSIIVGTFSGTVVALEVFNSDLIVAGSFPGIAGNPNIARYNSVTNTYFALGTGGTDATIRSLLSENGSLYVGGDFSHAGGIAASHLARWDGSSWSSVRGGTDGTVFALVGFNSEVHAGGSFLNVRNGAIPSPDWARYLETGVPWFPVNPQSTSTQCAQELSFTAHGAAGYSLSYTWKHNGAPLEDGPTGTGSTIAGAHNATIDIIDPGLYDQGSYTLTLSNACGSATSSAATLTVQGCCSSPDFNCDGDLGTDADIEAFFNCLAGNCPALPCYNSADFNGDGDLGTDADIESFFRVLAGGPC